MAVNKQMLRATIDDDDLESWKRGDAQIRSAILEGMNKLARNKYGKFIYDQDNPVIEKKMGVNYLVWILVDRL